MANDAKSSSCCSMRCYCCICCAITFCIALAVGIFVAIVATSFETPTCGVSSVTPTSFELTGAQAEITYDVKMNVSNPNNWPITGTLKTVTVTVYSLDQEAEDGVGDILSMSKAYLPSEVTLETNSITLFSVYMDFVVEASSAQLYGRLARDCSAIKQLAGTALTKIRLVFSDVTIEVFGTDADFSGFDIPYDMLIACDGSSADTTTTLAGEGSGSEVVVTTTTAGSLVGDLLP
mmetsp:Transcript_98721/g.205782  ORF Transcript_98721/g.205782 Transcript_98721/m.205782 type:complete len:234 (+) Transcript_98721:256-957(+)|eukprot:CAMPEP_0206487264 /NCGR_PEP_ID=MMETSP0324_2-20121206/41518_1 /ASSEMBLY_ACC=CAM_ASM_000836 /TAXON_ID=2866 /ORGANISM="Crypthecodinium cohnii, Strain Seligo" /LENGTH=233 /DNA_ID=CAMNT_0053965673 /DNA_START=171 /DNA_END=872 /DNA_ORIENTATION=+